MATLYGTAKVIASIASGGTTSQVIGLQGRTLLGIQTPAALTGTALTFEGSHDGETFVPLYDDAGTPAQISLTVTTSRGYSLDPSKFAAWEYIKVVSGSAEGAARQIVLLTGRVLA